MKSKVLMCVFICVMASLTMVRAQPSAEGAVPISRLIDIVSKKSGKKFVVDPRVKADVTLIGQEPGNISYSELLAILQVHGFAAVEAGTYVRVIPEATVRSSPVPLISGKETRADSEYVTRTIAVRSMPAMMLVPMLRPLLPQQAHLTALSCNNALIMVDTWANVRRLEEIVRALDTGEAYVVPRCNTPVEPAPQRNAPASKES